MPTVRAIPDAEATPEVRQMFAQLKEQLGDVPLPMRAMANHPAYLKMVLGKMQTVMGSEVLDQKTKLAVAFAVSVLNNCEMCITQYGNQLHEAGFTDEQIVEIAAVIDLVGSMNHFNNGMLIKPGK
ncbi:peroxiredoxin [Acididesulfobacillus acetoxydans]|uniref:Alkylhydroperoxidase AhpD core domain protein n=1 Tax=Acididesulfobacillus acetoxydans TaxID=1561005 RepID=A0A8S0VW17_9FIRM|nr:carboxymuconolactone decarboxylase family protein [Acididesulfobacillus acetoxydans]CAA7600313.1 peroxiredoxin [Acididesulfobacillus acetoxydans]CEJ06089.1 Alkylhydroperoxidase AhpD core domain protein [Acididesulfobacillus acetoxydans]